MSDPIGTSGLGGGSHVSADLAAVMQGGPTFIDRMEQLSARTAAHEKALNELALGRSARDAYLHAHNLKADAEGAHAEAIKVLGDANSQAAATLNAARTEAARIIAGAKNEAFQISSEASQIRVDAAAEADRLTGKVQALLDEAQATKDAAQAERDEVSRAMQQTTQERAKLALDRKALDERVEHFNHHYGRVANVMREAAHALV
jgi:hypothetical protein